MEASGFEAFLNERSFSNQFHDRDDFQPAIVQLVGLVEQARRAVVSGRGSLWMSERLADSVVQKGMSLRKCLNTLLSADLKNQFVDIVFNRACPKCWESEPNRHSSDGRYQCTDALPDSFERDVRDTSMAELAERKRQRPDRTGCLLNVSPSLLSGRPQVTVDAEGTAVLLDCLENEASLTNWLKQLQTIPEYGTESKHPPLDEQTCLVDRQRFERLSRRNKERQVYRNITSGEYYAVDSKRVGADAELEVFDKHERHKGTADIQTGRLRPGTAVSGRWLKNR